MKPAVIRGFNRLSTPEKILILEDLWDQIASEPASVPIPAEHRAELDRRLARHALSPGDLLTLEELKARIEKKR